MYNNHKGTQNIRQIWMIIYECGRVDYFSIISSAGTTHTQNGSFWTFETENEKKNKWAESI